MKDILLAIKASIEAEVAEAADWTVEVVDPVWRNPAKGKVLAIWGETRLSGTMAPNAGGDGFRATGYREDIFDITIEYSEPAGEQVKTLQRDEEAELDSYDTADLITTWADAHQALPADEHPDLTATVHRFDYRRTVYAPATRREAFSRYCQLSFQARKVIEYA